MLSGVNLTFVVRGDLASTDGEAADKDPADTDPTDRDPADRDPAGRLHPIGCQRVLSRRFSPDFIPEEEESCACLRPICVTPLPSTCITPMPLPSPFPAPKRLSDSPSTPFVIPALAVPNEKWRPSVSPPPALVGPRLACISFRM